MTTSLVAMLCGPHENGKISFRRIDMAVGVAYSNKIPLLVVGDGNNGNDLDAFKERSRDRGVRNVTTRYDPRANTLADVEMIATELSQSSFERVHTVYLVTDHWHMLRASILLTVTLLERFPTRTIIVDCVNVGTPLPPHEVLLGEMRGILHFLEGDYGQASDVVPFGKPAHPQNVDFTYDAKNERRRTLS